MSKLKNHYGQALVTLMIFVSIATVVITGSVIVILTSTISSSMGEQSLLVNQAAENGIENALLRLLRDPSYAGETINLDGYSTVITVTGTETDKIITANSANVTFTRKIIAKVNYNDNVMSVTFWQSSQ